MALNKLTADALVDGTLDSDAIGSASVTHEKLHSNIISGQTAIGTVDATNDLLLIYDTSTTSLKKVAVSSVGSTNTDSLTEGSSNLYFTNARADARITNALKDEDNMASNSATHIPSQQSVKAYVDTEVAGLVSSAPSTLDTLNELAAALGDDANFSTTVTSSIATKLPLSGGAMTGPITTNSTFDGVDIATRDAVLTATTNTANAALPLAGGTMTGILTVSSRFINATNSYDPWLKGIDASSNETSFIKKDGQGYFGGNVGIGTKSPSVGLELSGTGNASRIKLIDGSAQLNIGLWDGVNYRMEGDANRKVLITSYHTDGVHIGNSGASNLVIKGGKVGIGITTPQKLLQVKETSTSTTSVHYPITVGGSNHVANYAAGIGFDPEGYGNRNKIAIVAEGIGAGYSRGKLHFLLDGIDNGDEATLADAKMTIQENGDVNAVGYISSKKGTIQTVVNQATIYTSINPVQVWAEASSSYRVSITPKFASGTKIFGTFSIPINPTGAANILMSIQPWYSTDGGTTKTVLNQGGPAGSRITGSHAWFRSSNGYDINDMQNHIVHFAHSPGATTTMTWGFYFRSEGSNTTYFCYSSGNSGLWGWTAPVYMELREVEVA
jgi:hypothetical protein